MNNLDPQVGAQAKKDTPKLDNLLDCMESRNSRLSDITNDLEGIIARLSGEPNCDKKLSEAAPVRAGFVGRFDDNLDNYDAQLNRLENMLLVLNGHV